MSRRLSLVLSIVAFCVSGSSAQTTRTFLENWKEDSLFQQWTSQDLMPVGKGLTLDDHILIEDDGPASGYSPLPGAAEILKKGVIIRKTLIIDRLPVKAAYVAALMYPDFPSLPNNGRHVIFNINGHDVQYEVNHFWTKAQIPVSFLRKGKNEITVRTMEPDTRFKMWIALDSNYRYGSLTEQHSPGRSSRSTDGGISWRSESLGIYGDVSGEYPIRLALTGYHSKGWLLSPVIDMAANSDIGVVRQPVQVTGLRVSYRKIIHSGDSLVLLVRTGNTPDVSDSSWSGWASIPSLELARSEIHGRFLQMKFLFRSSDPLNSPTLMFVSAQTTYFLKYDDVSGSIKVVSSLNHPLVQSALSFKFEDPQNARLQEFRKKYNLDSVLYAASTEFEKLLKLKTWVAKQWKWHLLRPEQNFLAWDADQILTYDSLGTRGGFCIDYAIVFMEAAQSFGIPVRIVIMNYSVWGGHEVPEVWSEDYGKWIMLDPNFDTYFVDPGTGVPYNALELHRIFLNAYYPHSSIDRDSWSRKNLVDMVKARGKEEIPVMCITGGGADGGTLTHYAWLDPMIDLYPYTGGFGFLSAGYLRYMPRSNFLSQPYPIPVNEGRTHWPWTGYYCWYDERTPAAAEDMIFTTRENDLYWNLNEVDFSAEAEPGGVLRISLNTDSPYFNHYEIEMNGKMVDTRNCALSWNLAPGFNVLKMTVVDSMGNHGKNSTLKLIYLPLQEQN